MRRRGGGGGCVGGGGRGLRRRCGVGDVSMAWCYTAAARDEWTKNKLAWSGWRFWITYRYPPLLLRLESLG